MDRVEALARVKTATEGAIEILQHSLEDADEDKLGEMAAHLHMIGYQMSKSVAILLSYKEQADQLAYDTLIAWYQIQGHMPIPHPPDHTDN